MLEAAGEHQTDVLAAARAACSGLLALVSAEVAPTARQILRYIEEKRLFIIPDVLMPFASPDDPTEMNVEEESGEEGELSAELAAWRDSLEAPLDEIERYHHYIEGDSGFDTHQGVKGLEFPRVMVIVSDEEAGGFMFAYDKLFGAKDKGETDLTNEAAGKETSIDRTRRLFYVTCSRAEESLAIVYYVDVPEVARAAIVRSGWFADGEIEVIA